jgi:NAD(P)-dependent dehydrogenase (short-subunit alcohol dehydrogenase family)
VITGGAQASVGASRSCRQTSAAVEISARWENGEETASFIREEGGSATSRKCDITESGEVQSRIGAILKERGRIDILVNNAGVAHIGDVLNTTEEDLDRVYRVNVKGAYHCLRACIPKMIEQGGGVILNLASIASLVGSGPFRYSLSKGRFSR